MLISPAPKTDPSHPPGCEASWFSSTHRAGTTTNSAPATMGASSNAVGLLAITVTARYLTVATNAGNVAPKRTIDLRARSLPVTSGRAHTIDVDCYLDVGETFELPRAGSVSVRLPGRTVRGGGNPDRLPEVSVPSLAGLS